MSSRFPTSKLEWGHCAQAIISGKMSVTAADIPALLERLQDMNWPGSYLIGKFLPTFGHDLIEPVRSVFKSGDDVWIYWVLSTFADEFDETFWGSLKRELESMTLAWNVENTHTKALYILARTKLMSSETIKHKVEEFRSDNRSDRDDCEMIEVLLSKS
ncbi:MAG: DUF5071 domain-containing protein [Methylacidiphilales bacterium]|nr:DUF5071 domain-containing protein [Candidatus Methylacidiphilales bacterium]